MNTRRFKLAEIGAIIFSFIGLIPLIFFQNGFLLSVALLLLGFVYAFGGAWLFFDAINKYNDRLFGAITGVVASLGLFAISARLSGLPFAGSLSLIAFWSLAALLILTTMFRIVDPRQERQGFYNNLAIRLLLVGIAYGGISYFVMGRLFWD